MFPQIPFHRVNWLVSSFLIGTLFLSVTAVPLYLCFFGIDGFQIALFFAMLGACGFSITLGYHRLFSHLTFQAHWIVRFFTVIFGAGAFEHSVLLWSCEHRSHHKHVDHDDDPYCITKGLFYAHMGWLLFKLKPLPPFDNVADLKKDPLLVWQDRYIHLIAVLVAFVLPASIGFVWGGWKAALGAFLIAGVLRVVVLQHCTFCINSLCHYIGAQPYSSKCSARDSWLLALLTFGEGYHNYLADSERSLLAAYVARFNARDFDAIRAMLADEVQLDLVSKLRRVPTEKIVLAELAEAQRRLEATLAHPGLTEATATYIANVYHSLRETAQQWTQRKAGQLEVTHEMLTNLRNEIRFATNALRLSSLRRRQPS